MFIQQETAPTKLKSLLEQIIEFNKFLLSPATIFFI